MFNRTARPMRLAVAALAGALLVTGCASTDSKDKEDSKGGLSRDEIYVAGVVGDTAAGTPKAGGTLEVIDYAEARSLDPTKTIPYGAVGGNPMAAIYDVLLSYDATKGVYEPLLAESIESADNKTWTLKLREGVKFSDGTPLDAEAVIGSITYFMTNKGFNTLLLATNIADMKAADANTVVFTLNDAWATFPAMLASGPGMILAPAAIKGGPDKFKPIGAGPFKFESYRPAEELIVARNDDYFGEKPLLDKIRFSWVQADQAKLDALKNGSTDVINVRTTSVLEQARNDGFSGAMNPAGIGSIVWINNREGRAGNDVRIRKAISLALDPQTYLDRAQKGAGVGTRGIYSSAFAYSKEIELPETDLDEAKKLVEEAKADGAKTKLTFIGQSDQASQTGAVTIEAMLDGIGLDVDVELLTDVTEQTTRIYGTRDFDLAMGSMSIAEDPYMSLSNNIVSTSPANPSGFANAEMDKLINELKGKQPIQAVDTLASINELWQEQVPGAVLTAAGFFSPWNENVHHIVPSSVGLLLFHKAWKS